MKKIINGKRYDTEKSICIGSYDNLGTGVESMSDFSYWEASLYMTPISKQFFIAGEGGPMSRFGKTGKGTKRWGADLIPFTRDEALAWAEKYLPTRQTEKYFGDLIKDA